MLWSSSGGKSTLLRRDARSVSWDISEGGIIVGMVQDPAGRHHAFRREHGRIYVLDDLPHPRGWRFESAYAVDAVDAAGRIAGIDTYRGVATAFVWKQ